MKKAAFAFLPPSRSRFSGISILRGKNGKREKDIIAGIRGHFQDEC